MALKHYDDSFKIIGVSNFPKLSQNKYGRGSAKFFIRFLLSFIFVTEKKRSEVVYIWISSKMFIAVVILFAITLGVFYHLHGIKP